MPNLANAKKALRQAKKRTVENLEVKTAYKKALKEAKKTIEAGKDAKDPITLAQKKLDKAVKKGVIKKGASARHMSRLMKKANTLKK